MIQTKWRYYEGTTSADNILKDISKVLCIGVRDKQGNVIQERNFDIVYPDVDPNPPEKDYKAPLDKRNLTNEEYLYKIKNQLRQIKDRVILKTVTTPIKLKDNTIKDDLSIESDLSVDSIEMYIELYKPSYLIDPEKYSPETEHLGIMPLVTVFDEANANPDDEIATPTREMLLRNNHFFYMRAFDKLEIKKYKGRIVKAGPKEETKDDFTGVLVETDCHISEWAKVSWYQDFREIFNDIHDADIGEDQISDGVTFSPLVTPGVNGDTRIRFWINTNNDRVSLIIMGNPSLDLTDNRHLISFVYLGKIKSFDGSINDTAGNFAITASSSTYPYNTIQRVDKISNIKIDDPRALLDVGFGDNKRNKFFIPLKYAPVKGTEQVLINGMIQDSKSYKIDYNLLEFKIPPADKSKIQFKAEFVIPEVTVRPGVIKDDFGNIMKIFSPNKYGKNTATCVTDVGMYHTRSKAYWQKHLIMFNTTEEYMSKCMYGKSAYTNEYYADRIKLTHGNDGPRGMLDACLVIDKCSLVPLDDLVQNRDFKREPDKDEETYIYFPITANYSLLSTGPNAETGIALLKEIKRPAPKSDKEAVDRVAEDLYIGNIKAIVGDFTVPLHDDYNSTISWTPGDSLKLKVNDGNGKVTVTRPKENEPAAEVKLTANITVNGQKATKVFNCIILPLGISNAQAVAKDKEWLVAHFGGKEDFGTIKTDLIVPVEGPHETTITWESDNIKTIKIN